MDELTRLIMENKNLIYYVANKFTNYPNKEDLFQAGAIGFQKGYECYDKTRNVKLSTHVFPYIFGEMSKFVREDRPLKVSRDLTKIALQFEKASILLTQKYMREPSFHEVCMYLNIEPSLAQMALSSGYKVRSMDEVVYSDEKDMFLSDFIEDKRNVDIDQLVMLKDELQKLTKTERNLIERRYFKDLTQNETANELGMSQVQVSRQEQKILRKMRDRIAA